MASQLEAGTVWVNDWHMVNAAYPFGGYKQSGLGRELGPHALDEYTELPDPQPPDRHVPDDR